MIQLAQYVDIQSTYLAFLYKSLTMGIIVLQFSMSIRNKQYLLIDTQSKSYFYSSFEYKHDKPLSIEGLTYCQQYPCKIQDGMSLMTSLFGNSFIITHRVNKNQKLMCTNQTSCLEKEIWRNDDGQQKSFTVMPEYFTLNMEHSIGDSQIHGMKFSASNRLMNGALLYQNGTVAKNFPSGTKWDDIQIQLLLEAAGMQGLDDISDMGLDDSSQTDQQKNKTLTYRQTGVLLELRVHYTNTESSVFGIGEMKYYYKVYKIPSRTNRIKQVMENEDGTNRQYHRDYGIRIIIQQSSEIGVSSFSSFLTNVLTPTVTLTGIVYTILYYIIVLDPRLEKQRKQMIVKIQQ